MYKFQYDEYYVAAEESNLFIRFTNYEDEEAFARELRYGKYQ